MNKRLPCYIVSDLLPLYQDDILSEQTKKDIDKHLTECRECQKKMAAMKTQLDIQNTNVDLKINPLKKVRFYQKILTVLGAVIALSLIHILISCHFLPVQYFFKKHSPHLGFLAVQILLPNVMI